MAVGAVGAAPHVGLDDRVLFDVEVVEVGDDGPLDPPVERSGRRCRLEEIAGDEDQLGGEELVVAAEEGDRAFVGGADARGRRQRASFDERVGDAGQDEEEVVAADGKVALEQVLVVGVPAAGGRGVELVRRRRDAPAVGLLLEVLGGRRRGWRRVGGCRRFEGPPRQPRHLERSFGAPATAVGGGHLGDGDVAAERERLGPAEPPLAAARDRRRVGCAGDGDGDARAGRCVGRAADHDVAGRGEDLAAGVDVDAPGLRRHRLLRGRGERKQD